MENHIIPPIFAFIFDSGKLESCFYGQVVCQHILQGSELKSNVRRVVISEGDILDDRYIDIEPYLIKDDYCTVDLKKEIKFKDYPFCWIIEDLSPEVAKRLDERLKRELAGYIGVTRIDVDSTDQRHQFWKKLIRHFVVDGDKVICFQDPELSDSFNYSDTVEALGYVLEYVRNAEYIPIKDCVLLQSSIIKKDDDLIIKSGKSDIDRNILDLNFKLCRELQIAGVLIWKSIVNIDKIRFEPLKIGFGDSFANYFPEYPFLAVYTAAQGIERIQKIIVELICKADHILQSEKEKVYNLLTSHNHHALNNWIREKSNINISSDEDKIIALVQEFYKNVRYSRFSDFSKYSSLVPEYDLLLRLFGKTKTDKQIKEAFGKALGGLTYKYFSLIYELCHELNIYTYEQDDESASNIIFYYGKKPNNLYLELKQRQQGKKELLYWLIRNGQQLPFIDECKLEPLDFDVALINDYTNELIRNSEDGSQLFHEVDCLYDELCSENKAAWKERIELIDSIIANPILFLVDDEIEE